MAYLDKNRDVIENADVVVWEFMSGGLSAASEWPGYYIFPDHKPLFLKRMTPICGDFSRWSR